MYICVECKREMRCEKNGVGAHFGHGHVYASDCFECPKCGRKILVANTKPYHDPEMKGQDEYLDIDQTKI